MFFCFMVACNLLIFLWQDDFNSNTSLMYQSLQESKINICKYRKLKDVEIEFLSGVHLLIKADKTFWKNI